MNRIVPDHYPVSNLPEGLREGISPVGTVPVVIGFEDRVPVPVVKRKPMTGKLIVESIKSYQAPGLTTVTADEAVVRIRALRDEWDD